MSMDLGGAKGGVKADINVTPLVDVMLVLLIIMMLIAPMLQQGVSVKLPKADNTVDKPEVAGADGRRDRAPTRRSTSTPSRFRKASSPPGSTRSSSSEAEKIVLIKADEEVEYGAVMAAMDSAPAGGRRGHRPHHRDGRRAPAAAAGGQ